MADLLSEFKQYDVVEIIQIKSCVGFKLDSMNTREPRVGDVATIVEVYKDPHGYELECSDSTTGVTVWLHAFDPSELIVKSFLPKV